MAFKFKKNDPVYVTKGRFKNVAGNVFDKSKDSTGRYYDIYVTHKVKRGKFFKDMKDSGLGLVVDVDEKDLKEQK